MTQAPDDEALLRRYLAQRQSRDFERLVRRHFESMTRLALSVLGPDRRGDAEDVVQNALVKLHDQLPRFRGECRFTTWLHRLVYNCAIDVLRSGQRRDRRHRRAVSADTDATETAEQAASAGQQATQIRDAVSTLPDIYRAVIHAYYWLELPVNEIAALLGVAPGTVKAYLHRARARLKADWPEDSDHA